MRAIGRTPRLPHDHQGSTTKCRSESRAPPTPAHHNQVHHPYDRMGDEGGFGAGRPLVDRGREAPGQNVSAKGGEGVFTKQPTPCFSQCARRQHPRECRWTRGYRGNKRRAHRPMVLVVGNRMGRCDIETAPSRGSYDDSCCPALPQFQWPVQSKGHSLSLLVPLVGPTSPS